ncbi:MAG: IS66 family transposase [Anaerolineae bacterium]
MMENSDAVREELGIPAEDWERTPASVRAIVLAQHQMVKQIAQLEAEIADLREQIERHSGNSSQPPSSDGPQQKAERKPKRKGRRKRGGQKGHPGHKRDLLPIEQVDEVIVHKPTTCAGCGSLLLGEDPAPRRWQVTEIPPVKAIVTEHQVHTVTCTCCGQATTGQLPEEVAGSQFGASLTSMATLLMGVYRLSKRRVVQLLRDVYGIEMGIGSVIAIQQRVSDALEIPFEQAADYVRRQPVCNIDETGWKQGDAERSAWLWVGVTPRVTLFRVALSRGSQVAKTLIDEEGDSIAGTDRASAYTFLGVERRQLCWAHLRRNFQAIADRSGPSAEIGHVLLQLTADWLGKWNRVRDGTLTRRQFIDRHLGGYRHAIRAWLEKGTRSSHAKTARTCRAILKLEPALWTFAHVPGVEPTNNSAERALRHAVIWRKLCHGTQSDAGSRFVERILTTVETCRQQDRSPLDFIRQAVAAHWAGRIAPSLLPI